MARAAFVHSPELDRYPYPPECPFSSQRAGRARSIAASMGMLGGVDGIEVSPDPATRETLLGFHTERYLAALEAAAAGELDVEAFAMGIGSPECPVFAGMYAYAALACGATLTAGRLVTEGRVKAAFNPSGGYHHARPAQASGFCYINDVAIACGVLAAEGRRVFYLDIDAHHGDGVQEAFYDRADVMTLSFHETGKTLFPGTGFEEEIGTGDGRGYCANVPLPAGTYDEAFGEAFEAVAPPLIEAFAPDVIVMEVGMDMLAGDPLTHLSLTNNAYADAVGRVAGLGRPLLAVGGGGYNVENTARGWALVWSVLCGHDSGSDGLAAGMGGVMLESTEWHGGLRDRAQGQDHRQRQAVRADVAASVEKVRALVFPVHGL